MKLLSLLLSFTLVFFLQPLANAESVKSYKGRYLVSNGWSKTVEVANLALGEHPVQQGTFKIELVKENWAALSDEEKALIHKRLLIEGVVTGKVDKATGLAQHILTNEQRTGALYSKDDQLMIKSGDLYCSQGKPLQADEVINLVHGTGEFSGLIYGHIKVSGSINTCFGHSEFLQNNFTIDSGTSYIDFAQ